MNRCFLAAGVLAGLPPILASEMPPAVIVKPYDHQHVYESGASGFTWYWNHLRNGSPNRDQVFQWLFVDLNIDYIRCGFKAEMEPVNDNDDPLTIDWSNVVKPQADEGNHWVFRRAKLLNPDLKNMCYGFSIPSWLRSGDGLDYENPDLYTEIAEWMFINMVSLKQTDGIDCDILDIYNEPDYSKFGREHVGNLIEHVVPLLRGWVEDPERNPYGIKMPRIMAPSCLSAKASREWLIYWQENEPKVWNNIDIVSTHQYAYADDPVNYTSVDRIRGGRDFMQSEMHTGGMTTPATPLQAATRLGKIFSCAVNGGVSVYDYYMGVSPQELATSLVRTPWRKEGVRRKVYFAFKQLSSMQTKGSSVVPTRMEEGMKGCQAIAYHRWGERKTWVTITSEGEAEQPILLKVLDHHDQALMIESVRVYETSESRDGERVLDETFPEGRLEFQAQMPGCCLRTFEITWAGDNELLAADDWEDDAEAMTGGTGWNGGWTCWGFPPPGVVVHERNAGVSLRGNRRGGSYIVRELATPLVGNGLLRFKWDMDGVDHAEWVRVQVFDGRWHQVWHATNANNFDDQPGVFDRAQQHVAEIQGFGPVTKIRFALKADHPEDCFHVDDVEVVALRGVSDSVERAPEGER